MAYALQTLIREPSIQPYHQAASSSATEDAHYHPLIPRLQLFLSNNSLRELPGELVRLRGLTVLAV